jgi:hypothetical protein
MNLKDPDLIAWCKSNRETLIGQLVLYHSPVSLAELLVDDEKLDDKAIGAIKRKLEMSEELLKAEASQRKKDAKSKPVKPKTTLTPKEEDDQLKKNKAKETEKAVEIHQESKVGDIFVDDDFVYDESEEDESGDAFSGF